VGVAVGWGDSVGVGVSVPVGELEGIGVAVPVELGVAAGVGVAVGVGVWLGVDVGAGLGVDVGASRITVVTFLPHPAIPARATATNPTTRSCSGRVLINCSNALLASTRTLQPIGSVARHESAFPLFRPTLDLNV